MVNRLYGIQLQRLDGSSLALEKKRKGPEVIENLNSKVGTYYTCFVPPVAFTFPICDDEASVPQ